MRIAVIGSGLMGYALAFDLIRSEEVEMVTLFDRDDDVLTRTSSRLGSPKVQTLCLDVHDTDRLVHALKGHGCAIGATTYQDNVEMTKVAILARTHFCDLGGNDDVVRRQLSMFDDAAAAGVCIIPNCGLAPGLANIIAARSVEFFDNVEAIHIRVGGLPQNPLPPFNYQLFFSVEGLINEYTGLAKILRNSKIEEVETLTDVELLEFPHPFENLEAFNTSGGASLLPDLFQGRVGSLDYKTIRYRGHCEKFKTLLDLGFASNEPVWLGSKIITVREMFLDLLKKKLAGNDKDAVLMRITIQGDRDQHRQSLRYQIVDYFDEINNITSMMRMTSYPTSLIAQMILRDQINEVGVFTPEQCVPLKPLLVDLSRRGIMVEEVWS